MEPTISILSDTVERVASVGNITNKEEKSLDSFFHNLSAGGHFDSGILPLDGTGILAIRKAMQHTQIVFQHKPDKYLVTWGTYEHDAGAVTYEVAQPYRIVIGDIIDGNLLGARMFYSPVAVQTGDQIMHHVNLPNLNCKGYKGTSVGWMCLYHTQNWTKDAFDTKVRKLLERASGAEAYNDANMSSTDGPRFYTEQYKASHPSNYSSFDYLWNPAKWQAKTKTDGIDWTLSPGLWIPIKVNSMDDQNSHAPNGIPLTLEMAMLGGYNAYYSDPHQPKPVNAWARGDLNNPPTKSIWDFTTKAFVTATKKAPPPPSASGVQVKILLGQDANEDTQVPPNNYATAAPVNPVVGSCFHCSTILHKDDTFSIHQGHHVCDNCFEAEYDDCNECGKAMHYTYLQAYELYMYCKDCHEVFSCGNCGKHYLDELTLLLYSDDGTFCVDCSEYEYCSDCGNKFIKNDVHIIEAQVPNYQETTGPELVTQNIVLCNDCMSQSVTCGCGLIKHEEDTGLLDSGVYACSACIDYTEDGVPCFIGTLVTT